ncbi:restriction endonuclease subunit S [Bacillus cytotoxicus]|uniref:Restriction endonuclease subunit S n=1 Tax=Bacillus cytotoxicus TaxID=580165 RepID=A0ACC6A943_9BACI|nr:restriction endonuclease subunit S [Bacillus cytotoxicus]
MNVPKLRFKDYRDTSIKQMKFADILKEKTEGLKRGPFGGALKKEFFAEQGYAVYEQRHAIYGNSENIRYFIGEDKFNELKSFEVLPNDIIMSCSGTIGKLYKIPKGALPGVINQALVRFRVSENVFVDYFYYLMNSPVMQRKILESNPGSAITNLIPVSELKQIKVTIPQVHEQMKIGNFFKCLDMKIHRQQEKMNLLKEQKKGYMQKIFKQEIRFKDDRGEEYPEWQTNKLLHYLFEHKIRNFEGIFSKEDVLSVSGDYGIINQIKFQGRSFAGESVANYHVVHTGDIVYTKSPLKKNPYGIIKVNKGVDGIVSTLYAVYSCKENLKGEFLDYYFQLDDNTNSYLRPLVNKGAKNDMKVNNTTVLQGEITIPSIQEQQKIIDLLSTFDKKIQREQQKLEDLQAQKKGYMQQMFI